MSSVATPLRISATAVKRFVFVTSDQARGETRAFLDSCGQPSVTKPYDLSDLINAIGSVSRRK